MIKVTKDENLDPNDGLYIEPKQKPNKQRGPQTVMLEQPHSRSLPLSRIPLLFFSFLSSLQRHHFSLSLLAKNFCQPLLLTLLWLFIAGHGLHGDVKGVGTAWTA